MSQGIVSVHSSWVPKSPSTLLFALSLRKCRQLPVEKPHTLPPIIMVLWKMGVYSNMSFLSINVVFHFHRLREKGYVYRRTLWFSLRGWKPSRDKQTSSDQLGSLFFRPVTWLPGLPNPKNPDPSRSSRIDGLFIPSSGHRIVDIILGHIWILSAK